MSHCGQQGDSTTFEVFVGESLLKVPPPVHTAHILKADVEHAPCSILSLLAGQMLWSQLPESEMAGAVVI